MNRHLQELADDLADARRRARRLADRLADADWLGRRPDGGWSPAECFAHLNLSASAMLPRIRDALERGRREGVRGDGPYSMNLLGRWLCWYLEPPYRVRSRTGAAFEPEAAPPKTETMEEFERGNDAIVSCIRDAEGLDLSRLNVVSPFDARVSYNLFAAFRIVAAHIRRHVWQAEQAVAARQAAAAPARR